MHIDEWNDLLTSFNGSAITYDEIGNPLTYGAYSYTWSNGRQLESVYQVFPYVNTTYQYNDEGVRTSKIVSGVKHEYTVSGGRINREVVYSSNGQYVTRDIRYYYDAAGNPISIRAFTRSSSTAAFTDTMYYLLTNMQGDVVAIYNANGERIFEYVYDAWGNILRSKQVATGGNVANSVNPFRYRGYYYDTETGLYYLQSRYYNPEWGRFLNADNATIITDTGTISDKNMFAYCDNNPVMRTDENGEFWNVLIGAGIGALINVGVNYITAKMDGQDYTLENLVVDAACGAITGATAASGIPVAGQAIVGAIVGFGGSAVSDALNGETEIDVTKALNYAASGALGGLMGGNGIRFGNSMQFGNILTGKLTSEIAPAVIKTGLTFAGTSFAGSFLNHSYDNMNGQRGRIYFDLEKGRLHDGSVYFRFSY